MNGTPTFLVVPIGSLRESPFNPRKHFDQSDLADLAASIRARGILTPILARPHPDFLGVYEIAAGHRRFRAAQMAGLTEVPILLAAMSDEELLETLVIENNQRQNPHPLEEAVGYRSLLEFGYTQARLGERIGRSQDYVQERLRLLSLGEAARAHFLSGAIEFSHARLLSRLTPDDQERAITLGLFSENGDAVRVRAFAAWITTNIRLTTGEIADLFPQTDKLIAEEAQEEAEQPKSITRLFQLPSTQKGAPILTSRNWKRADGNAEEGVASEKCEVSFLGVVVLGPGRGEAFHVCADKHCDIHWSEDLAAAEAAGEAARQAREERHKAESEARVWTDAADDIFGAFAGGIAGVKVDRVAEVVLAFCAHTLEPAAKKRVRAAATDDIRRAALAVVSFWLTDAVVAQAQIPEVARSFGVALGPVLRAHRKGGAK